jgi:glyoxylase-like metal-dependent hydrolase (beta-lactamase superfamily II)
VCGRGGGRAGRWPPVRHPDFDVVLVPNVTLVVGTRGALVVDTGMAARNGQSIMREVDKVSRPQGNAVPELYLVTTHIHPEHDLGAGGFPARTKMLRSKEQEASDIAVFVEPDRVPVSGDLMMGLPQFTAPSARFATWFSTLDRFDALKPVRDRAAALKKDGRTIDDTVRTLQDELQGRFNRNQMASAVRAAYNEAQ